MESKKHLPHWVRPEREVMVTSPVPEKKTKTTPKVGGLTRILHVAAAPVDIRREGKLSPENPIKSRSRSVNNAASPRQTLYSPPLVVARCHEPV